MCLRFLILLLFLLLGLTTDITSAIMRPSASLSITNGEGFVAYLEVPKNFGAIKNCWLKFKEENKIKIELNATEPIETARDEFIVPFTSKICGVRVNKVSTASIGIWTLEAENLFGDFEQDRVTLRVLPAQKTRFDTKITREIGDGTISCSKHESYTKHCKIIDDVGEVSNTCELLTSIRPNRTFECLMYNWGRLEESHEYISVDIKDGMVYSIASMEETEKNIILRCQFKDTLFSCQAVLPDHKKEIYIMDGLYNGRYSAYDTIIKQSRCSLEIPKPLTSAEQGLWRIINYEKSAPSGCLFYVGKNKTEIIDDEIKLTQQKKVIKVYQPEGDPNKPILELSCTVPYVIKDCYLKDPNNTVYFPDSYRIQRQGLYGKCSFINMPVIAGTWMCGARGKDYQKEVLQEIEVIVKPRAGEVLTDELKSNQNDALQLMCTSAFEEPISHCAYIDPLGRVHLVGTDNSIKKSGRVQYFGRGLAFGECGAKILNVAAEHFGEWKCQFMRYSRAVSVFSIQLRESATAHATSVGLGIGITVMIVLILGVVVGTIFYRKRHNTARHNFHSTDPLAEVSSNLETTST